MNSFFHELGQILWPPFDIVSGEPGNYDWSGGVGLLLAVDSLCEVCGAPVPDEDERNRVCPACLENRPAYEKHRALFVYAGIIRELIHKFKYGAEFWVLDFLKSRMANLIPQFYGAEVIIPIPLTRERLEERGYNQSHLLAELWGKALGKTISGKTLVRKGKHISQTTLNRQARQEQLRDVFFVKNAGLITGKTVLLVDDVHTTGATLNAAARVLKNHGAASVLAVSVAVVPSPGMMIDAPS